MVSTAAQGSCCPPWERMGCHAFHPHQAMGSILLRQPFASQRPRKVELRGLSPFSQIAGIPPACLNCKSGSQRSPWSRPGGQKVGHRLWQSVGVCGKEGREHPGSSLTSGPLPEPALPPDLLPPKTIPLMSQGGHRLHTATMQPARLPNPPLPRTQRRRQCQVMVLLFRN